ncbi:hypothetical protein [Thioclava sp. F1Mire-8]|uniref:hypothetical protein n=1 Tax=Thioclava sp. F1Mire-8 TaxID=1973006 RepID=UPI0011BD1B1C|nr:hypothetical protein [Thioclava sp. F1Mire-8]
MQQPGQTTEIDLLLLCGARPPLLEITLQSFSENVFSNFKIANVFANIDKFQGGESEVRQVEEIILQYFPNAVLRKPDTPSFTRAVMWLWGSVRSPFCLHLEDDWVANSEITAEMIFPNFTGSVRQVSILTAEKNWPIGEPYHCKWKRRRILGLNFGRIFLREEPVFTTSPSFLERNFAAQSASLMNTSYDPEKQLYNDYNPELREFTKKFKNKLVSNGPEFLISDIGRSFRKEFGIKKYIIGGKSTWSGE